MSKLGYQQRDASVMKMIVIFSKRKMLKYNHIKYDSSDEIRHITKFVPVIFLLIIALNSLAKFKIMRILAPAPVFIGNLSSSGKSGVVANINRTDWLIKLALTIHIYIMKFRHFVCAFFVFLCTKQRQSIIKTTTTAKKQHENDVYILYFEFRCYIFYI